MLNGNVNVVLDNNFIVLHIDKKEYRLDLNQNFKVFSHLAKTLKIDAVYMKQIVDILNEYVDNQDKMSSLLLYTIKIFSSFDNNLELFKVFRNTFKDNSDSTISVEVAGNLSLHEVEIASLLIDIFDITNIVKVIYIDNSIEVTRATLIRNKYNTDKYKTRDMIGAGRIIGSIVPKNIYPLKDISLMEKLPVNCVMDIHFSKDVYMDTADGQKNLVRITDMGSFFYMDTRSSIISSLDDITQANILYILDVTLRYRGLGNVSLPVQSNIESRIRKLKTHTFKISMPTYAELIVNTNDMVYKGDMLGRIEDKDVLITIDVAKELKLTNYNVEILHKLTKVLHGEIVAKGSLLASKSVYLGLAEIEVRSEYAGMVDLSQVKNGQIRILSLKEYVEIRSGVEGLLSKLDYDGTLNVVANSKVRYIVPNYVQLSKPLFDGNVCIISRISDLNEKIRDKIVYWNLKDDITKEVINYINFFRVRAVIANQLNISSIMQLENLINEYFTGFCLINGVGNELIDMKPGIFVNNDLLNFSDSRIIYQV